MNHLCDLGVWSQLGREEALREARTGRLHERARAQRGQHSKRSRLAQAWRSVLLLLGRAKLAD
jgi:hypothetical protein